ncbi:hypothetical protein Bbelb_277380 [Branchiostoma belcheri]|nr:hypothetical protein Bbelb_277380 [Branchiostoma belcheri]
MSFAGQPTTSRSEKVCTRHGGEVSGDLVGTALIPSLLLKRHVIMSRPVLLALVLLTVAVTTMLVAGNNICRLATYTKELRLHGRVQYVQAGECIVRTNYHIHTRYQNSKAEPIPI